MLASNMQGIAEYREDTINVDHKFAIYATRLHISNAV
jgi:hypothetical protein